jgi:polar amino acid transport system substrate-binding protein
MLLFSLLFGTACAPAAAPSPTAAPAADKPAAAPAAPAAAKPQLPTTGKLAEIKQRGSVNIYMEAKYRPYEYVDESGKVVGIDPDLTKKIFEEELGITVNITDVDFPGLITSLATGKADMIASAISATRERAERVDFTIPYSPAGSVVLIRPDDTSIKTPEDLSGKVVASQTGSVPLQNAEAHENELKAKGMPGYGELRRYADFPSTFEDLRAGRVDAVISGYSVTALLVKERPGQFKILSKVGPPSFFAMAVPKGETEFAEYLNTRIRQFRKDGTIVSILKKW